MFKRVSTETALKTGFFCSRRFLSFNFSIAKIWFLCQNDRAKGFMMRKHFTVVFVSLTKTAKNAKHIKNSGARKNFTDAGFGNKRFYALINNSERLIQNNCADERKWGTLRALSCRRRYDRSCGTPTLLLRTFRTPAWSRRF